MDFWGDAKLRSLQSDGYMYLDEELIDIEYFCCLAHSRAKFKKILEQGCEKACYFLLKIGNCYSCEEEYTIDNPGCRENHTSLDSTTKKQSVLL